MYKIGSSMIRAVAQWGSATAATAATAPAALAATSLSGSHLPVLESSQSVLNGLREISSSSQARSSNKIPGSAPGGLIEVREYTLKPEGMIEFLKISAKYADARKELLPFLGMFTCDVGGVLNRVVHFYHYKDLDQRDEVRAKTAADKRWQQYISEARPHVLTQHSQIMLEAKPVYEALGLPPTSAFQPNATAGSGASVPIYELRSYQLHPGYGSVPKLVEAFKAGLPHKVKADPEGQLAFFGYVDIGMLNSVVELWRYPSAQECIKARQASRVVPQWRECIGTVTPGVQHFSSAFMKPVTFSPWK